MNSSSFAPFGASSKPRGVEAVDKNSSDAYIQRIRSRKAAKDAARKERDKRRKNIMQEHKNLQTSQLKTRNMSVFKEKITMKTAEEQEALEKLNATRAIEDYLVNSFEEEKQSIVVETQRKENEKVAKLQDRADMLRTEASTVLKTKKADLEKKRTARIAKDETIKVGVVSHTVDQLLHVFDTIIDKKEETFDAGIPVDFITELKKRFLLADFKKKDVFEEIKAVDENIDMDEFVDEIDAKFLEDYLSAEGMWAFDEPVDEPEEEEQGTEKEEEGVRDIPLPSVVNHALGRFLTRIYDTVAPPRIPEPEPILKRCDIKAVVLGECLGTVIESLKLRFLVHDLNMPKMITDCVAATEAEDFVKRKKMPEVDVTPGGLAQSQQYIGQLITTATSKGKPVPDQVLVDMLTLYVRMLPVLSDLPNPEELFGEVPLDESGMPMEAPMGFIISGFPPRMVSAIESVLSGAPKQKKKKSGLKPGTGIAAPAITSVFDTVVYVEPNSDVLLGEVVNKVYDTFIHSEVDESRAGEDGVQALSDGLVDRIVELEAEIEALKAFYDEFETSPIKIVDIDEICPDDVIEEIFFDVLNRDAKEEVEEEKPVEKALEIDFKTASVLQKHWANLESVFSRAMRRSFHTLRSSRELSVRSLITLFKEFDVYVCRELDVSDRIATFETEFNGVEQVLRHEDDVKEFLANTVVVFIDEIYAEIDKMHDANKEKREEITNSGFYLEILNAISIVFLNIIRVEGYRYAVTREFLKVAYCMLSRQPIPEVEKLALRELNLDFRPSTAKKKKQKVQPTGINDFVCAQMETVAQSTLNLVDDTPIMELEPEAPEEPAEDDEEGLSTFQHDQVQYELEKSLHSEIAQILRIESELFNKRVQRIVKLYSEIKDGYISGFQGYFDVIGETIDKAYQGTVDVVQNLRSYLLNLVIESRPLTKRVTIEGGKLLQDDSIVLARTELPSSLDMPDEICEEEWSVEQVRYLYDNVCTLVAGDERHFYPKEKLQKALYTISKSQLVAPVLPKSWHNISMLMIQAMTDSLDYRNTGFVSLPVLLSQLLPIERVTTRSAKMYRWLFENDTDGVDSEDLADILDELSIETRLLFEILGIETIPFSTFALHFVTCDSWEDMWKVLSYGENHALPREVAYEFFNFGSKEVFTQDFINGLFGLDDRLPLALFKRYPFGKRLFKLQTMFKDVDLLMPADEAIKQPLVVSMLRAGQPELGDKKKRAKSRK
ncbi:hypothetical protein PCE1_004832 [Barthelona sp. PCE]